MKQRLWVSLLIGLIGIYLVMAGIGKILEPISVYRVLEFDGIHQKMVKYYIVLLLSFYEVLLGFWIILRRNTFLPCLIAALTFIGFFVQNGMIIAFDGPSLCGCLGYFKWMLPEFSAKIGGITNGIISSILLYQLYLIKKAHDHTHHHMS